MRKRWEDYASGLNSVGKVAVYPLIHRTSPSPPRGGEDRVRGLRCVWSFTLSLRAYASLETYMLHPQPLPLSLQTEGEGMRDRSRAVQPGNVEQEKEEGAEDRSSAPSGHTPAARRKMGAEFSYRNGVGIRSAPFAGGACPSVRSLAVSLGDDLCGLMQDAPGDRNEHGACSDQGVELGHLRISVSGLVRQTSAKLAKGPHRRSGQAAGSKERGWKGGSSGCSSNRSDIASMRRR